MMEEETNNIIGHIDDVEQVFIGGGAVDSVNGKTGVVILNTSDITDGNKTIEELLTELNNTTEELNNTIVEINNSLVESEKLNITHYSLTDENGLPDGTKDEDGNDYSGQYPYSLYALNDNGKLTAIIQNAYNISDTSEAQKSLVTKKYVDDDISWLSGILEYKLNSKQDNLSEEQLQAINSGITSEKIKQYDTYETTKQGILTFDELPTLLSNNPVKSNGIAEAIANSQSGASNAWYTFSFGSLDTGVETVIGDDVDEGDWLYNFADNKGFEFDGENWNDKTNELTAELTNGVYSKIRKRMIDGIYTGKLCTAYYEADGETLEWFLYPDRIETDETTIDYNDNGKLEVKPSYVSTDVEDNDGRPISSGAVKQYVEQALIDVWGASY